MSFRSAFSDIHAAYQLRAVSIAFANEDITDQHRRTALGPIWLLLNYLAFTGSFVVVFGSRSQLPYFASYAAIGLLVWFYIAELFTQSVSLFIREQNFIKGTPLPLSIYVSRLFLQSAIRAAYALPGCIAIILITGVPLKLAALWAFMGIFIIMLTAPAAITIVAMAGAFFPDLQFVITNIMRLGIFLTPIFWAPSGGNDIRSLLYKWNPFTYYLEIVRAPILSGDVPFYAFGLCMIISLVLWFFALLMLGKFRQQIVFLL